MAADHATTIRRLYDTINAATPSRLDL